MIRTQRSILVPTWEFDDVPTVTEDAGGEQPGFPVTALQDPQPRVEWRTLIDPPSPAFVADYGLQEVRPMDAFVVAFCNFNSGATLDVQWGNTNGVWHTDALGLPLWPGAPSGPEQLPGFWYAGGGRGPIALARIDPPMTTSFRFMRVKLNTTPVPPGRIIWGRFTAGLAVELDVVHGSEVPIPVGAPAREQVRWDAEMPLEQYEQLVALIRNSGSEPRFIESWGRDRYLVDGARTVFAIGDYAATEPWRRHASTVYGPILSCPPPRRDGALYKTSISVEGL